MPRRIPVCGCMLSVLCAYDVTVRVVSGYVHNQTPHGQVRRTHRAQTTYSHIPEYDEACTPTSSNCTSTVIDP